MSSALHEDMEKFSGRLRFSANHRVAAVLTCVLFIAVIEAIDSSVDRCQRHSTLDPITRRSERLRRCGAHVTDGKGDKETVTLDSETEPSQENLPKRRECDEHPAAEKDKRQKNHLVSKSI